MAKRREVSGNYRMMVSALQDCEKCFGTGIELEQIPHAVSRKVEINVSVCMCVRIVPMHVAEGSSVQVRCAETEVK